MAAITAWRADPHSPNRRRHKKGEWEKSEFQRQMILFIVRNQPKKIDRFVPTSRIVYMDKTRHLISTFEIPRSSSWAFVLMWMSVGDNKNNDKQKKCFFPLFCTFSSFFEAREKICPFYQCHTYMVLWDRLRRMKNQCYKTNFIFKKDPISVLYHFQVLYLISYSYFEFVWYQAAGIYNKPWPTKKNCFKNSHTSMYAKIAQNW